MMNYKNVIGALAISTLLSACGSTKKSNTVEQKPPVPVKTTNSMTNPLYEATGLDYGAPDFSKYSVSDIREAILTGMKKQRSLVDQIATRRSIPNFQNTILELEKSNKEMALARNVFSALAGAHTNDEIKALQKELAPKFSEHSDAIYLNGYLFGRVQQLYTMKDALNLSKESLKLVEEYYQRFVKAGAKLKPDQKKQLAALNSQIAELQTSFNQHLLEATNSLTIKITDHNRLDGLTEAQKDAIRQEDGSWLIKMTNTTQQPFLSYIKDRSLRKEIYEKAYYRTESGAYSNSDIVRQLALLRAQKAELLGYNNYAEWSLQNTMAKTPDNVISFLSDLSKPTVVSAQREAQALEQLMQEKGITHDLKPWDWNYYAEILRKEKYDLDEETIKPYFELTNVLEKGVFYAAEKLYGITFKKRTDLPTYHPDVVVYEVFEEDGSKLGLFYGDYFSRDSKRGGAWMSNFVDQSKLWNEKPVIYNVCNNPKPKAGQPALLTYDQVETVFHEFGHGLHGLFADQEYPSLSGTAVARDFVEYPSQFNEYWALHPEILKNYALHYDTGEPIPHTLVDKIQAAATFNQGYRLLELISAASLDMKWHTLSSADIPTDVARYETEVLNELGLIPSVVPPRYRSTYFAHVFGGGYASGYYSYLWTEKLMHDSYQWFVDNGGLTRENGQRYRDMILSRGNTMDYEKMYYDFAGDVDLEPMFRARGLK